MSSMEEIAKQKIAEFKATHGARVSLGQKLQFGSIGKGTSCTVRVISSFPPKGTNEKDKFWSRTCILEGDEDVVLKFKQSKDQKDGFPVDPVDYVIPKNTTFTIREWSPKHSIPLTTRATINGLVYQTYLPKNKEGQVEKDATIGISLKGMCVPLPEDGMFCKSSEFIVPIQNNNELIQRYRNTVKQITGVFPVLLEDEDDEEDESKEEVKDGEVKKKYYARYHAPRYRFVINNKFVLPDENSIGDFLFSKNSIGNLDMTQDLYYYYTDASEKDLPEAKKKKKMGLSGGETRNDPVQFLVHQTDGEGNYQLVSVWLRLYDNNLSGLLLHPESDIGDWLIFAPQIVSGLTFNFIGKVKFDLSNQGDFKGFKCAVAMSGSVGVDLKKTVENSATQVDLGRVLEYLDTKKGLAANGNLENGTYTYTQLQELLTDTTPICCLTNIKGVNLKRVFEPGACVFYEYKRGSTSLIYAVTMNDSPIKVLIDELLVTDEEEAPPPQPKKKQKS